VPKHCGIDEARLYQYNENRASEQTMLTSHPLSLVYFLLLIEVGNKMQRLWI